MAKKFATLRDKMSPAAQARISEKTRALLTEMPLHELRATRNLTQEKIAEQLNVNQAAVSKLEHRTDMYVSTLRSYLRAMGGELEIVARFPEGDVRIEQFEDRGSKS